MKITKEEIKELKNRYSRILEHLDEDDVNIDSSLIPVMSDYLKSMDEMYFLNIDNNIIFGLVGLNMSDEGILQPKFVFELYSPFFPDETKKWVNDDYLALKFTTTIEKCMDNMIKKCYEFQYGKSI